MDCDINSGNLVFNLRHKFFGICAVPMQLKCLLSLCARARVRACVGRSQWVSGFTAPSFAACPRVHSDLPPRVSPPHPSLRLACSRHLCVTLRSVRTPVKKNPTALRFMEPTPRPRPRPRLCRVHHLHWRHQEVLTRLPRTLVRI